MSRLTRLLTERSTERSPKSTMSPPWMLGLTFCTILMLLPCEAYWELLRAVSRREETFLSRGYGVSIGDLPVMYGITHSSTGHHNFHFSTVCTHKLQEAIDHTLCLRKASMLGEDTEQVPE